MASLQSHGDVKYPSSELGGVTDWGSFRVEHRHVAAGAHNVLTSQCTELVLILSGRAMVRRTGDGQKQQAMALPGTSWLVPAGTHETQLELEAPLSCLHLYLPQVLLDRSALVDYEIDPAKAQLAYAGGMADRLLEHIGGALHDLLRRDTGPADRIFVDGVRTALAGHLLGRYTVDRWRLPTRMPILDERRLKRVLDFIEEKLANSLSLDDLAAEACYSPFHFARLFQSATGLSPHRYVTERRVAAAKTMLVTERSSLAEVALDTGFGSQASFTRTFRQVTGLTPGQYRERQRRR